MTRIDILNMNVLLPIKSKDNNDFDFMEQRIRELEEERIRELSA